jgi:hypothetical protein
MTAKAQATKQAKTPAAPAAARIIQPPVGMPERKVERPDIATQLEGADRFGHSFGAVGVDGSPPPIIQRQELPEEEEEELQMKREPAAIQRQELPEEEEEEELQMKPEPAALQRQELPEEEEELMLKPEEGRVGPQGGQVPPEVEAAIQRARGGGQPLERALQEQMGASLGHDFSGVRVHTDAEADDLNQQLQAKAFTTGPDIFFKRGAYDPGSSSGRELIVHELSHVVQQTTGRARGDQRGMIVRPSSDAFEQEAEHAARLRRESLEKSKGGDATRAVATPDLANPADILGLKRTVGNRGQERVRAQHQVKGGEKGFQHDAERSGRRRQTGSSGQTQDEVIQQPKGGVRGYDSSRTGQGMIVQRIEAGRIPHPDYIMEEVLMGQYKTIDYRDDVLAEGLWTTGMGTCASVAVAGYDPNMDLVGLGLAHWDAEVTANQIQEAVKAVPGSSRRAWVGASPGSNQRNRVSRAPSWDVPHANENETLYEFVHRVVLQGEAAVLVTGDTNCVALSIRRAEAPVYGSVYVRKSAR